MGGVVKSEKNMQRERRWEREGRREEVTKCGKDEKWSQKWAFHMGGVEKSQKNMQRERRYGREEGKEGAEEGRAGRRDVHFYEVKLYLLELGKC